MFSSTVVNGLSDCIDTWSLQVEIWTAPIWPIFRCSQFHYYWCFAMERATSLFLALALCFSGVYLFEGVITKLVVLHLRPVVHFDYTWALPHFSTTHCTVPLLFWEPPPGKRPSSFAFQVVPYNGLYLFNKVNPYKLQRLHWDQGEKKVVLPLLISCSNSHRFGVVSERVAGIIFSYVCYCNMGPFRALILPQLEHARDVGIFYIWQYDNMGLFPVSNPIVTLTTHHLKIHNVSPKTARESHGMQSIQLTTMALSLIAYFLE